jgi:hypothetical protein
MSDSTTINAGTSLDRLFDMLRSPHFTDHRFAGTRSRHQSGIRK